MIQHLSRTLLLAGGALAVAGPAAAQFPTGAYPGGYQGGYPGGGYMGGFAGPNFGAPGRPPLSPYLNILQGTGNPAVNYYNFTRPNLQAQQMQQQFFNQPPLVEPFGLASVDVSLVPQYDPTSRYPRPTGHPAAFGYIGGYYNSLGTIGVPFARAGQPAAARPQAPTPAAPRR
jgi:hypothetical protein